MMMCQNSVIYQTIFKLLNLHFSEGCSLNRNWTKSVLDLSFSENLTDTLHRRQLGFQDPNFWIRNSTNKCKLFMGRPGIFA